LKGKRVVSQPKLEGRATAQNFSGTDSGEEFAEALKVAREISWRNFGRRIRFYAPSFMPYKNRFWDSNTRTFPSISVTGHECALRCQHCRGRLLETMIPVKSPSDLVEVFQELRRRNAEGCLVSGGCRFDGTVPLEPFISAIAEAKRGFGLKVVVHTGIVNGDTADRLARAGIDSALIDVIGSDETIKEVYGLNRSVEDYDASLSTLEREGIPVVPHVLVGLHYGRLKGEFEALRMISRHKPSAVIIIGFTPFRGTPMQHCPPASSWDIASVIAEARRLMPHIPLALGCARPKGKVREEIDRLAIQAGVNAIAYPDPKAIAMAENLGLEYSFSGLCCSQTYEDLGREERI